MQDIPQNIVKAGAEAGSKLIEHSVFAAAFVFIFVIAVVLVWWVLRTSAKELARAHEEIRNVNARSALAAEKSTEVNTELKGRIDTIANLLDKVLDRLHDALARRGE